MPETTTSIVSGTFYRKMGNGPAVLLLHGFPETGWVWRKINNQLAESFTVIIPDFPGSGGSILSGDTSLSQMAESLKRIMEKENIDNAVIAGHSMGGYIALALARLYPSAVTGMSLVHSTPLPDDDEKKKTRRKAIELIQKGGKQALIRQVVSGLFSESFKLKEPAFVEQQIMNANKISDEGIINFYNGMIQRMDNSDLLTSCNFPVQWIIGEEDAIIPYKKIIPFCYLAGINFVSFYQNCAHISMFEFPVKLTHDIKEFAAFCYSKK